MKARTFGWIGLAAIASVASACMLVTGDYQVGPTGGAGGAATGGSTTSMPTWSTGGMPTSSTGGTTSTGGTGGTGGMICPGPPCTTASDCPAPTNDCLVATCNAMGCCDTANKAVGAACSSDGGKVCADPAGPNAGKCVACVQDGDCAAPTPVCDTTTNTCSNGCSDNMKNGAETDVDCGGGTCGACGLGKGCGVGNDCTSTFCAGGTCCSSACSGPCSLGCSTGTCEVVPKGLDGTTTCGTNKVCDGAGSCANLSGLKAVGQACTGNATCFNNTCSGGYCKLVNGDACTSNLECASGLCSQGACKACAMTADCGANSACNAGVCSLRPGDVCGTNADCFGMACQFGYCIKLTPNGMACTASADCQSRLCKGGVCSACTTADCASCNAQMRCLNPSGVSCASNNQCDSGMCSGTPFQFCQ